MRIFAYPQALFPPTDFHTATLVGNWIYIIGSLGYPEKRRLAETPVFKLNIEDFHIEPMATHGDNPGWIYRHYAYLEGHRIRVTVRNHCVSDGGEQKVEPQCRDYFLDLKSGLWECTVNGSES